MRIEILGPETDAEIKFELFQRLNTGGANLSEQEIRNCIVISINSDAYAALQQMAANPDFIRLTNVGEERRKRQYATELVVRFVVMRHIAYTPGMDLHEYLDKGIVQICKSAEFDWAAEQEMFSKTIAKIDEAVGADSFKKNNRFSLAMFEFVTNGTSKALERNPNVDTQWLEQKIRGVVDLTAMDRYSGSGVRGTQRLSGLIPEAAKHFS